MIETQIANLQERNRRKAEEKMTPVKQRLSHNTETTKSAILNSFVTKTSNVGFTKEPDLSNNTDKINRKSKNKIVVRKINDSKAQKSVIILGDSMVKHINGWEISKRLQSDWKVYVKQFSGATIKSMKNYITIKSYHFILHVGKNHLITERSPELIAKFIVDLATALKGDSRDASVFI